MSRLSVILLVWIGVTAPLSALGKEYGGKLSVRGGQVSIGDRVIKAGSSKEVEQLFRDADQLTGRYFRVHLTRVKARWKLTRFVKPTWVERSGVLSPEPNATSKANGEAAPLGFYDRYGDRVSSIEGHLMGLLHDQVGRELELGAWRFSSRSNTDVVTQVRLPDGSWLRHDLGEFVSRSVEGVEVRIAPPSELGSPLGEFKDVRGEVLWDPEVKRFALRTAQGFVHLFGERFDSPWARNTPPYELVVGRKIAVHGLLSTIDSSVPALLVSRALSSQVSDLTGDICVNEGAVGLKVDGRVLEVFGYPSRKQYPGRAKVKDGRLVPFLARQAGHTVALRGWVLANAKGEAVAVSPFLVYGRWPVSQRVLRASHYNPDADTMWGLSTNNTPAKDLEFHWEGKLQGGKLKRGVLDVLQAQ